MRRDLTVLTHARTKKVLSNRLRESPADARVTRDSSACMKALMVEI